MKILVVILVSLFISSNMYGYDPPIGIPDPGDWGTTHPIDATAPAQSSNWPTAEEAGYYYIDPDDPASTDTANTYGYPNKPRDTIPSTFAAGSYVEVHGTFSGSQTITFNGTSGSPIWFRGTSGDMPVHSGTITVGDNSQYTIMEYIDFNGGTSGSLVFQDDCNNICFRNSYVRNKTYASHQSGIGMNAAGTEKIHDLVFYNNNINTLGDYTTEDDEDFHGINPSTWSGQAGDTCETYNIWILGNTFYHLSGDGVQINGGNWNGSHDATHHIYIGDNTSYENRQSGFYSKQGSHIIISENTVYGMRQRGFQAGNGIGILYSPDNLWIIYNKVYDCNNGIRQGDCTVYSGGGCTGTDHDLYIVGNEFYDIHKHNGSDSGFDYLGVGIKLYWGSMDRYVVDNTIYDTRIGLQAIQTGVLHIYGNIIDEITDDADALGNYWNLYIHGNVDQDTDVDYEVLHDTTNERIYWTSTTYTSLSSWETATSECGNCFNTDPDLVNPPSDMTLTAGSDAIDSSIEHVSGDSVYDTFYSLYGIDIQVDRNDEVRPQGSGWEIGAYEYSISETVTVTGTALDDITETDIVNGEKTLIFTAANTTWVVTIGADNAITTAFLAIFDGNGSGAGSWDDEMSLAHGNLTRNSDTVLTLTLPATAGYDNSTQETVSIGNIPATATAYGDTITPSPNSFTIDPVVAESYPGKTVKVISGAPVKRTESGGKIWRANGF